MARREQTKTRQALRQTRQILIRDARQAATPRPAIRPVQLLRASIRLRVAIREAATVTARPRRHLAVAAAVAVAVLLPLRPAAREAAVREAVQVVVPAVQVAAAPADANIEPSFSNFSCF